MSRPDEAEAFRCTETGRRFHALHDRICRSDVLQEAWKRAALAWLVLLALVTGCSESIRSGRDGPGADSTGDRWAADRVTGQREGAAPSEARPASADAGPRPVNECAAPKPDWVFCDSFEAGTPYDGSTKTPVVVADPGPFGLAGNHAMQLRVPAGKSGGAGVWKKLPASDKLYARFYVMWEPGHDITAKHHGPGGLAADNAYYLGRSGIRPNGDDYFVASMEFDTDAPHPLYSYTYYRGMYQDCADPNGACWGDSFPCVYDSPGTTHYCKNPTDRPKVTQAAYQSSKWYCIEQLIEAGTPVSSASAANGVLDFWVDGLEVGPWSKMWWRTVATLKVNRLWLYLYHHDGNHSVPGWLFDNVVVSKTRIGCL